MDVAQIAGHVRSARDLQWDGVGRAQLVARLRAGSMIGVHRGWYVDAEVWDTWHPEQKHVARAIAAHRTRRGGEGVLSHTSAAALHGLPFHRFSPARVHLAVPSAHRRVRSVPGVARHSIDVAGEVVELHGMPVTSLRRTVADLIGRLPIDAAVALADAALRRVAWDIPARAYDTDAADAWRDVVSSLTPLAPGARGSVQARWVLAFADGRADLPGESVSRLHLHRLGFAPPALQVRVAHGTGFYDVDFGLDDVDVWAEFDGTGKYTDPAMRGGASPADVVLAEKAREDDIRGRTGRRLIRWGSAHIVTPEALRARLASFRIQAPGGPGRVPPTMIPAAL